MNNLIRVLSQRILGMLTRGQLLNEDIAALGQQAGAPLVYVLDTRSFSNRLVLDSRLRAAGLSASEDAHIAEGFPLNRSVIYLRDARGRKSTDLEKLLEWVAGDAGREVQLVPVSFFWGRAPSQDKSWFTLMFSDNWGVAGHIRKLLIIALHGRNTLVRLSPAMGLRQFSEEGRAPELTRRKVARVLRVHFRQLRSAVLGPDLSHRRMLVDALVRGSAVKQAIADEMDRDGVSFDKAQGRARSYAMEIAADYSYAAVALLRRLLARLWNKLYDGVEVRHIDTVQENVAAHEVVYVPCHRSHIDYLLLSYVLDAHGLITPHIAAGVNLNMPVIGGILRRGGAFFLRRSFKGNPLYATVFSEYLATILAKGVPLEYFIEGGRSRTGRPLSPRPGMLDMTIRAFLRYPRRPVLFVPVYIGYEKLVEGETFINELSGAPKKKESVLGLLRSLKTLKSRFGFVHVNFGEAIELDALLDKAKPGWRDLVIEPGELPEWLPPMVDTLGHRILTNINSASDLNPINLLSLVLLATPKQAMAEDDLIRQLDVYSKLVGDLAYGPRVTITELNGTAVLEHARSMGISRKRDHELGAIVSLEPRQAVLLTYFRNSALHLFALPALVASFLHNNGSIPLRRVLKVSGLIYPFLKNELYLRWEDEELESAVRETISTMREQGLLEQKGEGEDAILSMPSPASSEATTIKLLAGTLVHSFERYFITISQLAQHGPYTLSADDLENRCHLMAQRLSMLQEFDAPEFFDKTLFRQYIQALRAKGYLNIDEAGMLGFDPEIAAFYEEAKVALNADIRHGILQVTRQEVEASGA